MGDFGKAPEKVAATVAAPAVSILSNLNPHPERPTSSPFQPYPTFLPTPPLSFVLDVY